MKYFVVSYGGVGTHMLMPMIKDEDWLGNIIKKDNPAWMKYPHHLRNPVESFDQFGYNGKVKVIYVFGDPINSILSHFRRSKDVKRTWAKHHCVNIQGDHEKFNSNWTLDDYLNNGEDLFKLEEHFNNWTSVTVKDYDLMLLKYETSYKHEQEIMDYLDTDIKLGYRNRKSDWKNLTKTMKDKLLNMYGSLLDKIEKFDEIKII